ncbi:hypothetical protein [Nonomuraea polychroma]|uniref:hypothetical protein n=1 Tax=Nonomuraea polychroma TaxID=46176 RepID=UPI001F4F03AD|nr:hypothetical protein [Nonomuraea polychroma]
MRGLGADREPYAGQRVLVVGAGHSAATTLLAPAELEDTPITWAIRGGSATRAYGGGADAVLGAVAVASAIAALALIAYQRL